MVSRKQKKVALPAYLKGLINEVGSVELLNVDNLIKAA